MKKTACVVFLVVIFCVVGTTVFYKAKRSVVSCIPITESLAGIPLVEVEIQGKKILLKVDFGSKSQLTLTKDVLNQLAKQPHGTENSRDAKGRTYSSQAYRIPKVCIGSHIFTDVIAKELNEEYASNVILFSNQTKPSNHYGVIGRGLLEKMHMLMDVAKGIIVETKEFSEVAKMGYSLADFIAVPFQIGRTGAIIEVGTSFGPMRLSLDTGSTVSFARPSLFAGIESGIRDTLPYVTTSVFSIVEEEFGSMDLYFLDITPELDEIDGLIGMDFISKHPVYMDFSNRTIYISKMSNSVGIRD